MKYFVFVLALVLAAPNLAHAKIAKSADMDLNERGEDWCTSADPCEDTYFCTNSNGTTYHIPAGSSQIHIYSANGKPWGKTCEWTCEQAREMLERLCAL